MATREEEGAKNKPTPLVPAEVDLRDFAFMPLDVRRLRDSRFVALRSPEEVVGGLMLWSASWHQVPASSVPDDDVELSLLAGYGGARGVDHYRQVKAGTLHSFVLCSDGRWYHRVVAEKAAEAWNGRLKLEWRRACDRIRKENKDRTQGGEPDLPFPRQPNLLENVGQSGGIPLWTYVDSSGKSAQSSGITVEPAAHSAGKDPSGAGIPASVRARDRGQGTGDSGEGQGIGDRGQNFEKGNGEGASTGPRKPPAASPQVRTVQIANQIRALERSKGRTSARIPAQDAKVVAWVNAGVTDEQLREAYDLAVTARVRAEDKGSISTAFLDIFVQQVLHPGAWWESDEGTLAEGKRRGIEAKIGESFPQYRERIRATPEPEKATA